MSPSKLDQTLAMVSHALAEAQERWWIIGSAAVALHGGSPGMIADVDVIVARADLEQLYHLLLITNTPETGKTMFQSELFGRWSAPPLDVEFMAGLKLWVGDAWLPIELETRQEFALEKSGKLFAPKREELIAVLKRFGREKDLRRAASLEV